MASKDVSEPPFLTEPYKSLADDAIEEARKIMVANGDASSTWKGSFSEVALSQKSLKAVPDMIVRKKKRESRGGVTIYTSRSLPVSALEACAIVSDSSVQAQLDPDAKIESVVEDLGGDNRVVCVLNAAKGPVSARQMVVLIHKRRLENGTYITLKLDVKNHEKDPDPKNSRAYRMKLIEVVFYIPQDATTCRRCGVLYADLNLSSFIESTVYSFVCKSIAPKKLYMIGKIILAKKGRDRASGANEDESISGKKKSADPSCTSGNIPRPPPSSVKCDDVDTKDGGPSKRGPDSLIARVEPIVVVAIAAMALYRALRH